MALRTPDEEDRNYIDEGYGNLDPNNRRPSDSIYQSGLERLREAENKDYSGASGSDRQRPSDEIRERGENRLAEAKDRYDDNELKEREEQGGGADYENKYTGDKEASAGKGRGLKGLVRGAKKRGPLAIIIGIFITGFVSVIMLSPGLLVIHIAETITGKMNMQGGSMDVRTTKIYASMMKQTSGFCAEGMSIRCKFRTMDDKQIQKLEDAGIKVHVNEGETITGRKKVDSLEFKGKRINASSLSRELRTNPDFRGAARSAYNPWFAGFFDKVTTKVYSTLGINRSNIFDGAKNNEERTERAREHTKNGQSSGDIGTKYIERDGKYYETIDGEEVEVEDQEAAAAHNKSIDAAEELKKTIGDVDENGEKLTPKVLDAAHEALEHPERHIDVKSISAGLLGGVLSAPDTGCTLYGLYNAVSFGAKTIRSLQMARYAMIFLNTASAMKAGEITPEDAAYVAGILTKTVTEKVTDESGKVTTQLTKSATDSYGYRYAAYGDTGPLTPSATEFLAGGGLGGKMTGIANTIIGLMPGNVAKSKQDIHDICKFVKNPFVQAGSLIVSVGLLFTGPIGWSALATSLAFGVATDVGLSVAIDTFKPMIIDMVAGILIDDTTFGEKAGDALVSGSGVIMSTLAAYGGNAPLSPTQAVAYMNTTQSEALARHQEDDRMARSPFDPTSPNTFMGSIVSQLLPYNNRMSSITDIATTSFSIASRSLGSIVNPFASALENTKATYTQCDDEDYKRIGLATDPFCNPIRGIPSQYLEDDPVDIITRLIENESIDEKSGQPRSDTPNGERYSDFIKDCINRTTPLGYAGEEFDEDDGSKCFIEDSEDDKGTITARMKADWYVYHIDQRILDGIDNGYDLDLNCGPSTGGNSTPAAGMADAATIDALIEESEGGTPGPMHGMGATIIKLSNQYGVNSNFIVTVFKAETQFGTDGSAGATHNNFGWNAENGDGDCPSIPLVINGVTRMYNCYTTPEKGIEGTLKNITTNPAYKEVPPEAPPGTQPGTVAAVRNVYCPEGDGPEGDPASQCNLENFLKGSVADGIPLQKDDPVFLSSSGSSTTSSSTGTSTTPSGGAKISEQELKSQIESYGLPAPNAENVKSLQEEIQKNPDALWASQAFLTGEKTAKQNGIDVKEYLTTAWVWFETGAWADPYEVNCKSNTDHPVHETCNIVAEVPDKVQVAGYQAWDVQDRFAEIYNKLYSESDLERIMGEVIKNSSKASNDNWKYSDEDLEAIKGVTLEDIYPNGAFNDEKTQFLSFMLGKDPAMAAALNSFAVSDGDVITMLKDCTALPWSNNSYYCDPELRQKISDRMMALYLIDDGSASFESSCMAAAAFTTGKGLGSIVEGNTNPENNFKAEWGNGLYKYGIGHGTNGSEHTGIDIGGERGAAIYTPVSGTVVCDKTVIGTACDAFKSYKITSDDPGLPCPYHGEGTPLDGTGRIEIALNDGSGHTLILGHTLTSLVKVGDTVQAGQQVGTVGCMNGHHVHVEYRIPDPDAGYMIVDPEKYLGR